MKLSIIVPVYNVEKYINDCICSLIEQDFSGYEVILVDDGSQDKSSEICRYFTKKYYNFKLITLNHKGVSVARNTGLHYAQGEYITFLDSDDLVHPQMYRKMYNYAIDNQLDIVMCNFKRINESEIISNHTESEIECTPITGNLFAFAWNKIYKKTIFQTIEKIYDEGYNYEDHLGSLRLFSQAKRVGFIDEALYYYRKRSKSITATFNKKNIQDLISQFLKCKKYYLEQVYHLPVELIYSGKNGPYIKKLFQKEKYLEIINTDILGALAKCTGLIIEDNDFRNSLKEKEIIFWGGGEIGVNTIEKWSRYNIYPIYICDNNPKNWGTRIKNISVIDPHQLLAKINNNTVIIVTTMYVKEIYSQLKMMGLVKSSEELFDFKTLGKYIKYDYIREIQYLLEN